MREQTQAEAVDRIGRAQRRMRTANRSLTRSTILIIAVNVFTMTPLGFALLSYVVGVRLFLIGITQLFSVWRAREWAVRTVAKKGTNSLISVTTPSKRSANSSRGIPAVCPAPARGNEAHQPSKVLIDKWPNLPPTTYVLQLARRTGDGDGDAAPLASSRSATLLAEQTSSRVTFLAVVVTHARLPVRRDVALALPPPRAVRGPGTPARRPLACLGWGGQRRAAPCRALCTFRARRRALSLTCTSDSGLRPSLQVCARRC